MSSEKPERWRPWAATAWRAGTIVVHSLWAFAALDAAAVSTNPACVVIAHGAGMLASMVALTIIEMRIRTGTW